MEAVISARGIDIEAYRRFQNSFAGQGNRYWHPNRTDVFLNGQDPQFTTFDIGRRNYGPAREATPSGPNRLAGLPKTVGCRTWKLDRRRSTLMGTSLQFEVNGFRLSFCSDDDFIRELIPKRR